MGALSKSDLVLVLVVHKTDRASLLLLEPPSRKRRSVLIHLDRARRRNSEDDDLVPRRRERPADVLERLQLLQLLGRDTLDRLDVP